MGLFGDVLGGIGDILEVVGDTADDVIEDIFGD